MSRTPERIAWTGERASAEFGINPRTLAARLKQTGATPDAQGRWTTKQVAAAIFGDLEFERIRKTRAEAEQIEKENAEQDGDLVDVEEFCKKYETTYVEMKRIILSSKLPEREKDDLLLLLSGCHKSDLIDLVRDKSGEVATKIYKAKK